MFIMQFFSILVLAIVIVSSLVNYKQTVLIWLTAQLLFNAQVALRYNPPAMSLQLAVNLYLLIFYIYNSNDTTFLNKTTKASFPLWTVSYLILGSCLLTSLFSSLGTFRGVTFIMRYFITDIGSVFLAFKLIKNKKDLKLFVKCSSIVFLVIIFLGISEFILHDNIWADFVYLNSPHTDSTEGRLYYTPPQLGGSYKLRYGLIRALSTFGIHISFGVASLVYFWFFLLVVIYKFNYLKPKIAMAMASITIMGVFLCNSKTGMVGLLVILISFLSAKFLFKPKFYLSVLVAVITLGLFFPEYILNIFSLFNSDTAEAGGGSSVALRQRQFQIAWNMFVESPILGNGMGAISILKKVGNNSDILGAESVWMQILPERGIVGMIAYCYMYIAYYMAFENTIPHKILFFFLLSTLIMSTATGEITQCYWGVTLVAASKMFSFKRIERLRKSIVGKSSAINNNENTISVLP